jgi:hypothetical protein
MKMVVTHAPKYVSLGKGWESQVAQCTCSFSKQINMIIGVYRNYYKDYVSKIAYITRSSIYST